MQLSFFNETIDEGPPASPPGEEIGTDERRDRIALLEREIRRYEPYLQAEDTGLRQTGKEIISALSERIERHKDALSER